MAQQRLEDLFCILGLHLGGDIAALTFYRNKRGKLTFFDKAPPLTPPTDLQTHERNKFRLNAIHWNNLSNSEQAQYELAARRSSICMTGFNLFTHFNLIADPDAKKTISRQTRTSLV